MIMGEIGRVNRILEDILSIARPFQLKLSSQAASDIVEHVLRRYKGALRLRQSASTATMRRHCPRCAPIENAWNRR